LLEDISVSLYSLPAQAAAKNEVWCFMQVPNCEKRSMVFHASAQQVPKKAWNLLWVASSYTLSFSSQKHTGIQLKCKMPMVSHFA
jgi:hypothetical protein